MGGRTPHRSGPSPPSGPADAAPAPLLAPPIQQLATPHPPRPVSHVPLGPSIRSGPSETPLFFPLSGQVLRASRHSHRPYSPHTVRPPSTSNQRRDPCSRAALPSCVLKPQTATHFTDTLPRVPPLAHQPTPSNRWCARASPTSPHLSSDPSDASAGQCLSEEGDMEGHRQEGVDPGGLLAVQRPLLEEVEGPTTLDQKFSRSPARTVQWHYLDQAEETPAT
ncbi:hypothetical protein NDU88_003310 [Pleurodeles waltl]|uniref:Uncharacterized protein n=1 Tax=Pleurodeles waltl TaxID=8319 RepID=A0AAV7UBQ0_PLEWA|nr:hypothetical protein NDU88_003310 [Pleurodeles waltl]